MNRIWQLILCVSAPSRSLSKTTQSTKLLPIEKEKEKGSDRAPLPIGNTKAVEVRISYALDVVNDCCN